MRSYEMQKVCIEMTKLSQTLNRDLKECLTMFKRHFIWQNIQYTSLFKLELKNEV